MITVDDLVELAKEVEVTDPIDWGMLNINEDDAYRLIALSVIEQFSLNSSQTTLLATITKLVVENFVLNLKLMNKGL